MLHVVTSFLKRLYPELARFPDRDDRMDALVVSHLAPLSTVPVFIMLLIFVVAGNLKSWVRTAAQWAEWSISPTTVKLAALSIFMALMLGGFAIILYFALGRARRNLRRMLVERGVAICVPCGYDLRGIRDERCPECGSERTDQSREEVQYS
ncbi:MAG: hypothetical protein ACPGXK_02760 [Phycisphaerae bacterium]